MALCIYSARNREWLERSNLSNLDLEAETGVKQQDAMEPTIAPSQPTTSSMDMNQQRSDLRIPLDSASSLESNDEQKPTEDRAHTPVGGNVYSVSMIGP